MGKTNADSIQYGNRLTESKGETTRSIEILTPLLLFCVKFFELKRLVFGDVQTAAAEGSIIRASIPTTREEVGRVPDSQGIWGSLPLRTFLDVPRPIPIFLAWTETRLHLSQLNPQSVSATATSNPPIKQTILIAEDSNDGREMMRMLLGLKGYTVLLADNGVRAVEVALAGHPDLILLDLELPRLDGLGVVRILRSHCEFRDTPIILVTGHDPDAFRQSAIEAGCSEYLPKPIDFERLDTILQSTVPLN